MGRLCLHCVREANDPFAVVNGWTLDGDVMSEFGIAIAPKKLVLQFPGHF